MVSANWRVDCISKLIFPTFQKITKGTFHDTDGIILFIDFDQVDMHAEAWEKALEDLFNEYQSPGYMVYTHSLSSRAKEARDTAMADLPFLALGYLLLFVYMSTQLGSFSRLGNRVSI